MEWQMFERGRARVFVPMSPKALIGVIYGARCGAKPLSTSVASLPAGRSAVIRRCTRWQAKPSPKHFGLGILTVDDTVPRGREGRSKYLKSVAACSEVAQAP